MKEKVCEICGVDHIKQQKKLLNNLEKWSKIKVPLTWEEENDWDNLGLEDKVELLKEEINQLITKRLTDSEN